MDPVTGAAIGAGLNFLGGIFGGGGQPEDHSLEVAQLRSEYERYIAEMQERERQRQFNVEQAQNVTKQLEQLPVRDQISYLVSQRLGMAPGQFTPRDIYNPSTSAATPQLGGLDLAQYQRAASAYQPGMGGLDPIYEMYQTMGADLGYGAEPLMNQQGVFGGNRNPLPGQNYDASAGFGAGAGGAGPASGWQPPPLNQPPPPNIQPSGQFGVPKDQNKYAPLNQFNPFEGGITAYKDPAKIATGGAVPQPPGGRVRYSQNYAPPIVPREPGPAGGGAARMLLPWAQQAIANRPWNPEHFQSGGRYERPAGNYNFWDPQAWTRGG